MEQELKQKQIEEMTELMADWALRNNMCWHEGHAKALAETFAENDYEKIPEGAVVLTREEYDGKEIVVEMSGGHKLRLNVGKFGEMSKILEEYTRKETAEKFADLAYKRFIKLYQYNLDWKVDNDEAKALFDEICKELTDKGVQNGN